MDTQKIGNRIKKFRELKEVSIQDLSSRTGLDIDLLKDIEQDRVYPALGILLKISRALGTRLGTFIDDQISEDPVIITKENRTCETNSYRGNKGNLALKFYSLGRGKTDRHMEPFFIEIFPESKELDFSSHEGEEFIVVLSGEIQVTYGNKTYLLSQGDSIYYNSTVPHKVCSANNEVARIYAVLYIP